ncbi:MAG: hypothetical protein Q8S14_12195 [Algoriphagus sp.]|uniref:hypothetical protein n=1 Tax=Algoriphagus sp. TaxID=1872435 RepID=UPI0027313779|nr:hypothetical protein [Algoriphagus sp.]MDP2040262.1 hypothetical protein [Algoriphagus sp.]MDP3472624.1 hypothetical protein [Algoriphagus sp.]
MNDFSEKKRKIGPERVKKIFKENGLVISDSQSAQITEFVYTIAETLLGRGFKNPGPKGKKTKISDRL